MKNFLHICSCIYIFCYFVFNLCDACSQNEQYGYCQVEQWAQWGSCNATCGGGVQKREKYICCDTSLYHSLKGCLHGCKIPFSWWEANAVEHKTCGKCHNGGTFITYQNQCICPHGFGGSCCDLKDDCASRACQYGTCHDKDDGFHCDCVFFSEGKLCNTLKSWAIAVIALASLAVTLPWCCCCWWIIGTGKKDESEKTTKRMNKKIKPKPMERHSEEW